MAPRQVFRKVLKASAVNDRLCFPTRCLYLLPFEGDQLQVRFQCKLWRDGSVITLGCTRRAINDPKPAFTKVLWSEIVRRGNLQPGDLLTFYIDDEENPRYRIKVERPATKLFGAMIDNPTNGSNWLLVI